MYSSGEYSTADEIPKPEGLILMMPSEVHVMKVRLVELSPTGSLKFGDPGFAQSADQSDENGTDFFYRCRTRVVRDKGITGSIVIWAFTFIKG